MPKWHPVETVTPQSWVFPEPGAAEPYAEIRHLSIAVDGVPVWCFRAVRVNVEPRELIGYYGTLRDAAKGCHMHAIAQVGKGALSERPSQFGPGVSKGDAAVSGGDPPARK